MRDRRARAREAVLGAVVADAAACGLHWIYDVEEVARRGGDAPEFAHPKANRYHGRRKPGELTHYGDHVLVVLESMAERGGFDPDDYRERYVARFGAKGYDGYLDHATKDLLKLGTGSDDDHAGCLAKLPALVARYGDDPELAARIEVAVRVTHDNGEAVAYSLAAAKAIRIAILGGSPAQAVAAVAEGGGGPASRVQAVLGAGADHTAFAAEIGQSCPVPNAVPAALHAALHATDLKSCVRQENVAGGDTSGRLLLSAAIRGATDGVPEDWLARLSARKRAEELVDRVLAAL